MDAVGETSVHGFVEMIFVFGSNLAGRHGAGSAREALLHHGAIYGVGEGRQGQSYAIPTKDVRLSVLPLERIAASVSKFTDYAAAHPDETFTVVKIGCGLAGYDEGQIAPLFRGAPSNVTLPKGWRMPKFEAHITLDREHAEAVQKAAEITHWTFSQIDGDPIMGKKPYCYLTSYDTDAVRLYDSMMSVCGGLAVFNVPILRTKVEQIVFDSKTGVDELHA